MSGDFRFTAPNAEQVNMPNNPSGLGKVISSLGNKLSSRASGSGSAAGGTNSNDVEIAYLNAHMEQVMADKHHGHVKELAGLGTPSEIETPYNKIKFAGPAKPTSETLHSTPVTERSGGPTKGQLTKHINLIVAGQQIKGVRAKEAHNLVIQDSLARMVAKHGKGTVTSALKNHERFGEVKSLTEAPPAKK